VLVNAQGTDRLFLGDLRGRIVSFPDDPRCDRVDLAIDLKTLHPDLSMFYGLAFHPKFAENGFVYVCYVRENDRPDGSVVSRFSVRPTDPPTIDPASEQVLLTFWSGGHNGGCLEFGRDGTLFISTGDGAGPSPPDPKLTGQDCSDLLSSILRIDVDHPDPGRPYGVPSDNPFLGQSGVRPEIWAFGFRNPWKISVDRETGDLWVGDVGWELWELIIRAEKGGNYGWSVMEGPQPVHVDAPRGPSPVRPPTKAHPHSEAASITGGAVYRGDRLPELRGTYVYGDYQSGTIWGLRHDGQKLTWSGELAKTPLHLVAFGETHRGELYLIDHDRSHQIYRLVKNQAAASRSDFPRRLSQTGLFASTRDHRLAPGVVSYEINSPLWSDGETAERLLAIPGTGRIAVEDTGVWKFPEGSVLARTVSVERRAGDPSSRVRLETQVLHREDGAWRPYTYLWDDDQADASLADAGGATRSIVVDDPEAPGGRRSYAHRFAARTECILCHNPWVEQKTTIFGFQSASPLGLNTPQLNRALQNVASENGGDSANQLDRLHRLGLLDRKPELGRLPVARLAGVDDPTADLDLRVRSYLQTNCAHCHQFNAGGAATIALGIEYPLDQTRTLDARPLQGTFGIEGARIIAPGDPDSSVLLYRIAKLGGGRMPRIGSSRVDDRAVRLIRDWIARMPAAGPGRPSRESDEARKAIALLSKRDGGIPAERAAAIRQLTETTRGAMALLALVDDPGRKSDDPVRREAVALARSSPSIEVRDLFERFIPDSERSQRLGDAIDRAALLAIEGDPARGRAVFASNPAAQCKTCHPLGDAGASAAAAIGPDLGKIGAKYDRAALLDQILEPSRQIDPAFAAYLVETRDGRLVSGLLVERTNQAVSIRDAQGRNIRIDATEIEQLAPQARSLMPELLLRDLTPQQAADLLAYLASQK
jgi:uncharacterized repeat protein (TIGR03806 family)